MIRRLISALKGGPNRGCDACKSINTCQGQCDMQCCFFARADMDYDMLQAQYRVGAQTGLKCFLTMPESSNPGQICAKLKQTSNPESQVS